MVWVAAGEGDHRGLRPRVVVDQMTAAFGASYLRFLLSTEVDGFVNSSLLRNVFRK